MTTERTIPDAAIEAANAEIRTWGTMWPTDEQVTRALLAASPFLAGEGVAAVKPLEWHGPDIYDEFTARSLLGQFVIGPKRRDGSRWCMGDYHFTLDEAKAAAQQDYEARIRSSLAAPLPDTGMGEAVEALRKIEKWFGEFPETGQFWRNVDGTISDRPMSYAAFYGSNGERDYMRGIARAALEQLTRRT